ncbi:MAG: PEP-CTERM sorting domain-containing protein [Planctomycetota bacterium]|jgi:hypothetical protein
MRNLTRVLRSVARYFIAPAFVLLLGGVASAGTITITTDGDWDMGSFSSTNRNPPPGNAVKLDVGIVTPFDFIWVAASGRNTAVRIDTNTGAVLGEYRTSPSGMGGNPSRTTVDASGNVWVGNRDEAGFVGGVRKGSVTKISATASGPGTSTGVWNGTTFDARPWTNAGGADTFGGTSTASDSAILEFVRTTGTNVRTMAIDASNNLWTGGFGNKSHQLYDGATGLPVAGESFNNGSGGYGGLVDGNGILWSAGLTGGLVRYDPVTDISTNIHYPHSPYSYGLGIDTNGNIWNTNWVSNTVTKLDPNGAILGHWSTHGNGARGVAITPADNNVWIANSNSDTLVRLDNNGNWVATIPIGDLPTGVSVDSNGKVWVTNYNSNTAVRVDPATNMIDLTVSLGANARPYNYSDMTGTVLVGTTIGSGMWTDIIDSGSASTVWDEIFWNTEADGYIPVDGSILIEARLPGGTWMSYLSGDPLGLVGQFLELRATLTRGASGESPILSDIRLTTLASVPEPSALLLLGAGCAGVALYYRRRRKDSA